MKKSMILMSVLTLGVASLAVAGEYVSPDVGFKPHAMPAKEMKAAELGDDHYKVETGVANDRQIASQADDSDREPSSFVKVKDKEAPEMDENGPTDAPKPWRYKSKKSELK